MEKRFNIRVYGIFISDNAVLINEEIIRGHRIIKFPGGGLNWGEGAIDCLTREWREELNIDIQVLQHFYTTDFFQKSAYDDSQVISIYYLVTGNLPEYFTNTQSNERTYTLHLSHIGEDTFTLPIDKKVGDLLRQAFSSRTIGTF